MRTIESRLAQMQVVDYTTVACTEATSSAPDFGSIPVLTVKFHQAVGNLNTMWLYRTHVSSSDAFAAATIWARAVRFNEVLVGPIKQSF